MWARATQLMGIGVSWVGSGAAAPSKLQLELIDMLKPAVWMGMSSYGVHLANLAEAEGIDLANGSVKWILCTAEPLSAAKREKLSRMWGAEVFDMLGMTEVSMLASETPRMTASISGPISSTLKWSTPTPTNPSPPASPVRW